MKPDELSSAATLPSSRSHRKRFIVLADLPQRVIRQVARKGLLQAGRDGWRRVAENWRERRLGIETRGSIEGNELGHGDDSFGYQPIPYQTIDLAMKHVQADGESVFIDYGCGKGRAVVSAAMMPFQRVIGVELSKELCDVARRNVEQARKRFRCPDVQIVNADARDFVPPDEVSVVFFFNPFDHNILQVVLDRLQASWLQSPRPLKVIHGLPKCRKDWLRECDWLEAQTDLTDQVADWEQCVIYQAQESFRTTMVDPH
jgi:SAM-dependent methyltransferase